MCEILVRFVDSVNEDFYRDCMCAKAGDVIVVCPDGWPWGTMEVIDNHNLIIKLPNITVAQAQGLTSQQVYSIGSLGTKATLLRRSVRLNINGLNLVNGISLPWNLSALEAHVITKPYVADPILFGLPNNVIG
jgi:hypothetical protein